MKRADLRQSMEGQALFFDARPLHRVKGGGWGRTLAFGSPVGQRRADVLTHVPGVIRWAEEQAAAGRWVVLALAYESAPAFDPVLVTHAPQSGQPLAWAASHVAPLPALPSMLGPYAVGAWRPLVGKAEYVAQLAALRSLIAEGETYQANYTLPFECGCAGDDRAWFMELARAQGGGFCTWIDMGTSRVLSLSPELFFSVHEGEALARPMKGTAKRGATPDEDARLCAQLAACSKNRAENVMIVDLLRNDLGRVAVSGGVSVPVLFRVEHYPTVFQMTSDIRARLRQGTGLGELLAALFPCGSVTGAPKVAAMRILRELEPHPRGLYCGAIGLIEPGGRSMTFSVPIRTLTLERATGLARFGVGGGVTWDSSAQGEYTECQDKMRFVHGPGQDFSLLESLALVRGRYPYRERHLDRLTRSAAHFRFPLNRDTLRRALADLAEKTPETSIPGARHKVRLLVSPTGNVEVTASPIVLSRKPLTVGWAEIPAAQSRDLLLRHKTTRRTLYDDALRMCQETCPDCDDVLLVNEQGEVTESSRANLVLLLDGTLVTPPLECGLLPGVFRGLLLARGRVVPRVLRPADVARAQRVWLVNSVRGWMPCRMQPFLHAL